MPLKKQGWELYLNRLGQHQGDALVRTYGSYEVFIDGEAAPSLAGFMCECQGPGENEKPCDETFRRRIRPGTYSLCTHDTHYSSFGFSRTATYPTPKAPMPGFGLSDTDKRSGILVHPAHDGGLFLASIGCLNPTETLGPKDLMNIDDSRARVIALIESLASFCPKAFQRVGENKIAGASIVIAGEPLTWL